MVSKIASVKLSGCSANWNGNDPSSPAPIQVRMTASTPWRRLMRSFSPAKPSTRVTPVNSVTAAAATKPSASTSCSSSAGISITTPRPVKTMPRKWSTGATPNAAATRTGRTCTRGDGRLLSAI